jgi:hypothetical protein
MKNTSLKSKIPEIDNFVDYDIDANSDSDFEIEIEKPVKKLAKKIINNKNKSSYSSLDSNSSLGESDSDTESEVDLTKKPTKKLVKKVIKKPIKKKLKKCSDSDTDVESEKKNKKNSDNIDSNYFHTLPQAKIKHNFETSCQLLANENFTNFMEDIKILNCSQINKIISPVKKENFETIDQLLANKNFTKLIENIPKYKTITCEQVNKIIRLRPTIDEGYYRTDNIPLLENMLMALINRGYKIQQENYMILFVELSTNYNYNKIKLCRKEIFKDFIIDDDYVNKYISIIGNRHVYDFPFGYSSLNKDNDKTLENVACILCATSNQIQFQVFLNTFELPMIEKYLNYAKNESAKRNIRKRMTNTVLNAKIINKKKNDRQLLQCKTVEEIEKYIIDNNYNVSQSTIILACQNNVDKDVLQHLLTYKITFSEDNVNEIIRSYRNNINMENVLLTLTLYGYQIKKSNLIEMLSCKYYYNMFHGNLVTNFILDDEMLDYTYKAFKRYPENFLKFLESIQILGKKNKLNADGIVALYCSMGDEKEIKRLSKEYGIKLSARCLKYLYKQTNVKKGIIALFKADKVKPDNDVWMQYIETFALRKEKSFLDELSKQ